MTLLLLCILIAQIIIVYYQIKILTRLDKMNDLSNEDAQLRATTEQITEAKNRLPKQEK